MAKYGDFIQATTLGDGDVLEWVKECTSVLVDQIRGVDREVKLDFNTLEFIVHTGPNGITYGWKCESMKEPTLSETLLQMLNGSHLCNECPFDGGGVVDCVGIKKYKRCLIEEAAERLREV